MSLVRRAGPGFAIVPDEAGELKVRAWSGDGTIAEIKHCTSRAQARREALAAIEQMTRARSAS